MSGSDDTVAVVDDGAADVEPAKEVVLLQGADVMVVAIGGHLAAHDVLIYFRTTQSHCTTCSNDDDDDNNVHSSCAHRRPERSRDTY